MGDAPARVVFTTGFSRRYTGGVTEFAIEAKTLRGVLKAMDTLYPGLGEHLEAGADHVGIQVLGGYDEDTLLPALSELAGPLGLTPSS